MAKAPADGEEAWIESLHDREELLFGPMEGIEIENVATYPSPRTYSSFVGSIFEGTSITVAEVLECLPADHPFWDRYPEHLDRLQASEEEAEVGTLLDLAYEEPQWEAVKESYARSMQWFRLNQVVMKLGQAAEGKALSPELVAAVTAKLEHAEPGRGQAWRAAHAAFARAEGLSARTKALDALRALTSVEADRGSLQHFDETFGQGGDLSFLYEMFQLKWRMKSGRFDPTAERWQ